MRRTALMQICREGKCLLLHIAAFKETDPGMEQGLPRTVRELLAEPRLKKVGVGVTNDGWKLVRDFNAKVEGLVCLSDMARTRILPAKRWSLKDLLARVGGGHIPKPDSVRTGNWEQCPLTAAQRQYAVTDAYAGLVIYQKLLQMPESVKPSPTKVGPGATAKSLTVAAGAAKAAACVTTSTLGGVAAADAIGGKRLGPSKMNVYRLVRDGNTIVQASSSLGLRESTAQSYLYECLSDDSGLPWHFEWLHIPVETAFLVAQAAKIIPGAQETKVKVCDDDGNALHKLAKDKEKQAKQAKRESFAQMQESTTVFKAKKRRKGGVRAFFEIDESEVVPKVRPDDAANMVLEPPQAHEPVTNLVPQRGDKTSILPMPLKEIKARCPEHVSYSDIRFVMLAIHQKRLVLQPNVSIPIRVPLRPRAPDPRSHTPQCPCLDRSPGNGTISPAT